MAVEAEAVGRSPGKGKGSRGFMMESVEAEADAPPSPLARSSSSPCISPRKRLFGEAGEGNLPSPFGEGSRSPTKQELLAARRRNDEARCCAERLAGERESLIVEAQNLREALASESERSKAHCEEAERLRSQLEASSQPSSGGTYTTIELPDSSAERPPVTTARFRRTSAAESSSNVAEEGSTEAEGSEVADSAMALDLSLTLAESPFVDKVKAESAGACKVEEASEVASLRAALAAAEQTIREERQSREETERSLAVARTEARGAEAQLAASREQVWHLSQELRELRGVVIARRHSSKPPGSSCASAASDECSAQATKLCHRLPSRSVSPAPTPPWQGGARDVIAPPLLRAGRASCPRAQLSLLREASARLHGGTGGTDTPGITGTSALGSGEDPVVVPPRSLGSHLMSDAAPYAKTLGAQLRPPAGSSRSPRVMARVISPHPSSGQALPSSRLRSRSASLSQIYNRSGVATPTLPAKPPPPGPSPATVLPSSAPRLLHATWPRQPSPVAEGATIAVTDALAAAGVGAAVAAALMQAKTEQPQSAWRAPDLPAAEETSVALPPPRLVSDCAARPPSTWTSSVRRLPVNLI